MTCTFMSAICFSILFTSCFTHSDINANAITIPIINRLGESFPFFPGDPCGHIGHIAGFMSSSKLVNTFMR